MKTLIFTMGYILISFYSFCQTEKGRYSLGAGGFFSGYSRNKTERPTPPSTQLLVDKTNEWNVGFSPSIGKFVKDNFLVGGSLSASLYKSDQTSGSGSTMATYKSTQTSYAVGPFLQYFFGNGNKGRPFASVSGSYGFGHYKYSAFYPSSADYKADSDTKSVSENVSIGYALFLNDSFFLSFYLSFSHSSFNDKFHNSSSASTDTDRLNNRIAIGVKLDNTFRKRSN
jgi:hypothetical protein